MVTKRGVCLACVLVCTFLFVLNLNPMIQTSRAAGRLILEHSDPEGDDYGPGTYVYPTRDLFTGSPGLFDLVQVRVWDDGDQWLFDAKLRAGSNSWRAPEGFDLQLVDIYLDTQADGGWQMVPDPSGPRVQFAPECGWEYRIKIAPWADSRLQTSPDDSGRKIHAAALPDGRTLRAAVPKEWLPLADAESGMAVLVGSYDSLGPDHYRQIEAEASAWRFGGRDEQRPGPNVLDILAPTSGRDTQEAQLSARSSEDLAVVRMVYTRRKRWLAGIDPLWMLLAMTLAILAAASMFVSGLTKARKG